MIFETFMVVASLYSGIRGAQGAAESARAQSAAAQANAQFLREQADFARYMAKLDMQAAEIEHARHRSAQESVFAAAGVSLSGSVMAALGESEVAQERNHFRRLVASENDANYMVRRADMNDKLAKNIERAGTLRAEASILGGISSAGYWGWKGGMFDGLKTTSAPGMFDNVNLGIGTPQVKMNQTFLFPRQRMV
tara:strand:+ start:4557 stop:5141 length:585 start_codon:yes stop_codon:yes gene_type:complete